MIIGESRVSYAGFNTRQLTLEGAGPCIVLLHGFGHPSDCWQPVLARLAETGNAAIAVDLPGFGEADRLKPGPLIPQLEAFVADVVRTAGEHEPVVLVGNSLGAALAVRVAATDRGLPIGALVPTSTAGFGWTRMAKTMTGFNSAGLRMLGHLPVPSVLAHPVARLLLYGVWSNGDVQMVELLTHQLKARRSRLRLLHLAARFVAEIQTPSIEHISCPTTIVHGRRDRLISLLAARTLHEAIPGSRFVLIDEAGHCPHLDAAHLVALIASEHVEQLRESKSA